MTDTRRDQAPVIIIGSGLAGYSLARELRKRDSDLPLMMITSDDGTSYSKPMLSTGFTKGKSADELAQADAGTMADQLNMEIRTHTRVTGIDPQAHQILIGEERLTYHKLVLAWGADVIRLPDAISASERVCSINDLEDYRYFRRMVEGRRRVILLGAGLIGCEYANDLRNGGFDVTVVAPSTQVMPGLLPEPAADAVRRSLEAEGVTFHLGVAAESVSEDNGGAQVHLSDGAMLQGDVVVSAVGLRPRTRLATAAGLDVGHGIRTDRQLATSAVDIYALGDCAEVEGHVLMYVMPLMAAARALAATLTGEPTPAKWGAMPVLVKTPCCPVAVCPPAECGGGHWDVQRDGNNVRALYRDAAGELLGFAVTGDYVIEKQALSKEVPPVLASA
ncbi:FAD-dependent oxidoreductase [Marinobacter zhanjiangensis]|uniref:Pyridine nucleotide-disulfide oxidoreductase n=1 Tax=Marinobacter zhanjiangensis TaxID=578215 RepID=A0ABQ3ALX5_9GAMM|nr:FAD-dependent oxidoreductase [Marinobacter zhanjiangensis]GGY58462.1 pyridine nucleotide-disulfide oxidoreductase [Marinobacter zhanjiangensis]